MSKFGSLDKSTSKLSSFASTMQGSRIAKL